MARWRKKNGRYYVYEYLDPLDPRKETCFPAGPFYKQMLKVKLKAENMKAAQNNKLIDYDATLWEYCDKYLALPKQRRSMNTLRIIERAIFFIKGHFKSNPKLRDMIEDNVEAFLVWLRDQMSDTTAHIQMRNFKAIVGLAVKRGVIAENIVRDTLVEFGEPEGKIRFLNNSEKARLYAAAQNLKVRHKGANLELVKIIKTFLLTGVRRAELLNMWREHLLSVEERKYLIPSWVPNGEEVKSNDDYCITLHEEILPYFLTVESGPVWKRWNTANIENRFHQAAIDAGLPDVTPHTLRHTFAMDFLNAGGSVEELQKALNHAHIKSTMVYVHVQRSRIKSVIDKMTANVPPILKIA